MSLAQKTVLENVKPWIVPIDSETPTIDFDRSEGCRMYDRNVGRLLIDFATHYASLPLGYNHPGFFEEDYEKELLRVSRIKVANLDVLSESYSEFLETFIRVVGPAGFPKYFFIDGGALANENAMKAAFDWKIHRNIRNGKGERGTDIVHFREAFHGRSGYTLTVTNTTDPNKTKYFPKFDWPRVLNPKMRFPMTGENLSLTLEDERIAREELERIFAAKADDIAAILVEPIQSEGGDNHFRREFLQYLRELADAHDALLIFDEVQTGMCMTGTPWAWQGIGVQPDIFTFAKKAQVGGMVCSDRILEEPKNVFNTPSRISSTWGASLTDMVRSRKYLEIIERENLLENVRERGAELLEKLHGIAERTELIYNVRGRGLLIAFDVTAPEMRGKIIEELQRNGLLLLVCGDRSIRFRPPLNVTSDVIDEALDIFEKTLETMGMPKRKAI